MNKLIVSICFYVPLVISCLNLQAMVSKFIAPSLAQLIAYLNLTLIVTGLILFRNNVKTISKTARLWFVFYILYYSFGLLASGVSGFQTSIIATLVPVIFFTGFFFLLSNRKEFLTYFKVITICFVISSFITILFVKFNINMKTAEVHNWALDRAGGVTGDANAAAHTSIFAFIFFNQFFQPTQLLNKVLKFIVLSLIFYSLILTFSTTGLFTFTIVFFLINYKFFSGIRIILFASAIPLFYIGIFTIQSQAQNLSLSEAQINKVNNLVNVLTLNFDEVDNSGRGELLENITYYLYKNPIMGNGVDFSVFMRAHNTYVGIWVDAGIFTFLFFLFILFFYFLKTWTLNPQLRFFAMSILLVLYIFMISLQSVINQPYLIVLFAFLGYLIDFKKLNKEASDTVK
ncbi:O-antigen ligase family protein [Winogradskyella aurantia]|uniref:O-antigen ligase-related domain-containing protein n=1 Tax=Winogradskyella aurantia TaxID=1915063 RepID=A0A265UTI0_9FLAO|nr:O-antigen ligase family protein [Winogradskyella aurantia]OZV68532.1 hypothetical protein CA834_08645 [Winogradskyella aurantia]